MVETMGAPGRSVVALQWLSWAEIEDGADRLAASVHRLDPRPLRPSRFPRRPIVRR